MKSTFASFFAAAFTCILLGAPGFSPAGVVPEGMMQENVGSGWDGVAGVVAGPNADGTNRRIYGWEAGGKVWIVENGVRLASPLVDISAEVGPELSLLGFALDPDFQTNGYIYLLYTVDRQVLLGSPGRAPSIGRVTRYTCRRDNNFTSVDPASRKILIGESKSTGIPLLERSHGVGSLVFGEDGTLLVSTGDGAGGSDTEIDIGNSPNALQAVADGIIPASLNIGAWRSQSLDSMSGKILRIDPATGDGIAGNPYYQTGSPRSSRSRVWALGLRNPYRITIKPGTGSADPVRRYPGLIVLGDAGWNSQDSLFLGGEGYNMGWPAWEGFDPAPGYDAVTPPASVNLSGRVNPLASWTPTDARIRSGGRFYTMGALGSVVAGPAFQGHASIGGTFIDSDTWPAAWAHSYLHMDWGSDDPSTGWIRSFQDVQSGGIYSVQPFGSGWNHVSHLSFDKAGNALLCVVWPSTVLRITPIRDIAAPTIALTAPAVEVQSNHVTVNVTPSEPLTGLTPADFAIVGGDAIELRKNGPTYILTVFPRTLSVSVTLPAGVCTDLAGNGNVVSNTVTTSISTATTIVPGLKMEVFSDTSLLQPAFTQIASHILFLWGDSGPRADLVDGFSVRWSGRLIAPANPAKRLLVDSDDGIRLYVNGQLMIDSWDQPGIHWQQATPDLILIPGEKYDIVLEYRDLSGFATAVLFAGNDTYTSPILDFETTVGGTAEGPAFTLSAPIAQTVGGFSVEVSASAATTGLTASDFVVGNGHALSLLEIGNLVPSAGPTFLLSVEPSASGGAVTIQLPAGAATDAVGSPNTASNTVTVNTLLPDNDIGLLVNYFYSADLQYLYYSQDHQIPAFNWGATGLPAIGRIPARTDDFSFRAVGKIIPQFSETYQFIADCDDGLRLFVNGVKILDSWDNSGVTWQQPSAAIALTAGQEYDFKLEYREKSGTAQIFLFWQSPSQALTLIPVSAFRHHAADVPPTDNIPPAVAITSGGVPTVFSGFPNPNQFSVRITPSEPVTGLDAFDFVLTNCFLASTSPPTPA
ncbi:MAG: hypothetical protein JWL81_506, partial [Verrucomicrobiales bacterium]|nr:hypothetical protein [Verrucomicrobiales bacterium]